MDILDVIWFVKWYHAYLKPINDTPPMPDMVGQRADVSGNEKIHIADLVKKNAFSFTKCILHYHFLSQYAYNLPHVARNTWFRSVAYTSVRI